MFFILRIVLKKPLIEQQISVAILNENITCLCQILIYQKPRNFPEKKKYYFGRNFEIIKLLVGNHLYASYFKGGSRF